MNLNGQQIKKILDSLQNSLISQMDQFLLSLRTVVLNKNSDMFFEIPWNLFASLVKKYSK